MQMVLWHIDAVHLKWTLAITSVEMSEYITQNHAAGDSQTWTESIVFSPALFTTRKSKQRNKQKMSIWKRLRYRLYKALMQTWWSGIQDFVQRMKHSLTMALNPLTAEFRLYSSHLLDSFTIISNSFCANLFS